MALRDFSDLRASNGFDRLFISATASDYCISRVIKLLILGTSNDYRLCCLIIAVGSNEVTWIDYNK